MPNHPDDLVKRYGALFCIGPDGRPNEAELSAMIWLDQFWRPELYEKFVPLVLC